MGVSETSLKKLAKMGETNQRIVQGAMFRDRNFFSHLSVFRECRLGLSTASLQKDKTSSTSFLDFTLLWYHPYFRYTMDSSNKDITFD